MGTALSHLHEIHSKPLGREFRKLECNTQDQFKRNYYPPSPHYSPSYDLLDRFSQHYKTEKDRKERLEFLNDKYNLDYYSSYDSDSESAHKYETLI